MSESGTTPTSPERGNIDTRDPRGIGRLSSQERLCLNLRKAAAQSINSAATTQVLRVRALAREASTIFEADLFGDYSLPIFQTPIPAVTQQRSKNPAQAKHASRDDLAGLRKLAEPTLTRVVKRRPGSPKALMTRHCRGDRTGQPRAPAVSFMSFRRGKLGRLRRRQLQADDVRRRQRQVSRRVMERLLWND